MTKNRTEYYSMLNKKTPVMPIRLPSPEYKQRVKAAARAEGLSVSEWVRQAIARELDTPTRRGPYASTR